MYTTNTNLPSAFITFNKGRKKIYDSNKVYLNDGQNFEIELFNPTTDEILSTISLNGTQLSKGLIIRPGERIFLDRFLDVQKKFKFETYEFSNTNEVKQAIQNNGLIEVYFYKKNFINIHNNYSYTSNGSGITWTNTNISSPIFRNDITNNYNLTSSINNTSNISYTSSSNSIETGRVSEGETSNQNLINDNRTISWSSFSFHSINYKILPESTRPAERKDLVKSSFCTNCGCKSKEGWKFCASCGTKL